MRVGIFDRAEFRTFWQGQTYASTSAVRGVPRSKVDGPSDLEIGFKWQLIEGDPERPWLPTTALITSIIAPTGGTSPYSSREVNPDVNLIYG